MEWNVLDGCLGSGTRARAGVPRTDSVTVAAGGRTLYVRLCERNSNYRKQPSLQRRSVYLGRA